MIAFEDIQDVEDWLEPLGYEAFWQAVEPWSVFAVDDRAHFDDVLARNATDMDTMLTCLKAEVRILLTERLDLKRRLHEPQDRAYLTRLH
ncbi:hypothetical protein [Roseibium algae]|uniref:Uncharacterized protein n=1 Tax=Roseibium algae TaxID=3123038 RepID=A0ABU8TR82_9HYPH